MSITEKDIISFGKVLSELGSIVQHSPNLLASLLTNSKELSTKEKTIPKFTVESIENAENSQEFLCQYTVDELKEFIKLNHFGIPNKPNKAKLIDCILRNVNKENKDVFINYQVPPETESDTLLRDSQHKE